MAQRSTTAAHLTHKDPFVFFRAKTGVELRTGFWQSPLTKCRGTVVILQGRNEFLEKYFELIHDITQRGYHVFGFDWCGQGLSDRLLKNPQKGYVDSYQRYLDDLSQLMEDVVGADMSGPIILLAHSMGGHLAIRYLGQGAHPKITKVVLCAPMLGIRTDPVPTKLVQSLSRSMVRLGLGHLGVPGSRNNLYRCSFENNLLTSDRDRFNQMTEMVRYNQNLYVGSVTWGWLAATFDSIDQLCTINEKKLRGAPILVMMAGYDRIVCNTAIQKFVRHASNRRLVIIKQARHEILQEHESLRCQFWHAFDNFVCI